MMKIVIGLKIQNNNKTMGIWCNGSTTDSDSVDIGSNPSGPAVAVV